MLDAGRSRLSTKLRGRSRHCRVNVVRTLIGDEAKQIDCGVGFEGVVFE